MAQPVLKCPTCDSPLTFGKRKRPRSRRPNLPHPQLRFAFEQHQAPAKIAAPPWLWEYD